MAHAISSINGKNSIAFVGETPWHGLGQELTIGAPLETWLTEAGLDYQVERAQVRFGTGGTIEKWDARHVLYRSDTKAPLAVVSEDYQIVQPAEVLEFFRNLCADNGFALETAGSLYGGAKYWALAKTPNGFTLPGNDSVSSYVLLATSADGSLATTGQLTSVRVVCNNTLRASLSSGAKAIKVRHSSNFSATKMQVDLNLIESASGEFAYQCKTLAKKRLSRKEALAILVESIGDSDKKIEDQPNARAMGEILSLFNGHAIGFDMESSQETAWGLVNAATEYYDHHAGRGQDARLASSWFGVNAGRKDAIFSAALGSKATQVIELDAPVSSGNILDDVLAQGVRIPEMA